VEETHCVLEGDRLLERRHRLRSTRFRPQRRLSFVRQGRRNSGLLDPYELPKYLSISDAAWCQFAGPEND
jgi:hypothetical protein